MIGLDALQVVALEEGIITTETDYPSGEDFWAAVEALRDRGAHISEYQDEPGAGDPVSTNLWRNSTHSTSSSEPAPPLAAS